MALFSEAGQPASYVALPYREWLKRPEWPAVSLANTDPVEDLTPHVDRLRLVVLEFPKFSDGRAYSQARLLRGRLGYRGELRATGDVPQDQAAFMLRCGFDSFESEQTGGGEAVARTRTLFSVVHQPVEDSQVPVALHRLEQGHAAASGP